MSPLVLAVICLVVAAVLAVVDLLVPSGGVLAVAALVAALASVYFGFQSGYTAGLITLVVMLVGIPIFIAVALRLWPHTPIGKRVILKTPDAAEPALDITQLELQELVGQVGIATSPLMPSGFIRLLGRNYSAICESGYIETGQNVMVTAIQQRNLIVAATNLAPSAAAAQPVDREPATGQESLFDRPAEELGLDSIE